MALASSAVHAGAQISAGVNATAALHANGEVLLWGTTPGSISLVPALLRPPAGVTFVASGGGYVLMLTADGVLMAVGANGFGTLGDGTRDYRDTPFPVPGLGRVRAVSTSGASSYALLEDGTVRAWGTNASGQLGDGTTVDRLSPVQVQGLSDIVALATGGWGSATALRRDGTVWAWGENGTGNLGDGTHITRLVPVQVQGLTDVVSHCTGGAHSLALRRDGSVWAWGWNFYGQLAIGGDVGNRDRAAQITGLGDVAAVACGGNSSFVLRSDGSVHAFGANANGLLGIGNPGLTQTTQPLRVEGLPAIAAVSASPLHVIALARDGSVYAWGGNENGQLGDASLHQRSAPVRVAGAGGSGLLNLTTALPAVVNQLPSAFFAVTPSSGSAPLVVTLDGSNNSDPDGTIVSWDWTSSLGQTATGARTTMTLVQPGVHTIRLVTTDNAGARSMTPSFVSVSAAAIDTAPMVAPSAANSFALRQDGTVWGWGQVAQLALRGPPPAGHKQVTPIDIGLGGIKHLAAGWFLHMLAVDAGGSVWGWGFNASGELGAGTSTPFENFPVRALISDVVTVAAGLKYSLFLKRDGTVWAAGYNGDGNLGDGTRIDRLAPVQVLGLANIVAVSAGIRHSLALARDGRIWAWGFNDVGQLGDGSNIARTLPVRLELTDVARISAGASHSLALKSDGSVFGWGGNWQGQLGDGTRDTRFVPTPLPAPPSSQIAAGGNHSLALGRDGVLRGWGSNCYDNAEFCEPTGQVGNGSVQAELLPRPIALDRVAGIAAGFYTSIAYRTDGTVWMWGGNTSGQLGDGTFANRLVPQIVLGAGGADFFDVLPSVPNDIPAGRAPIFRILASDRGSETVRSVSADVRFRPQDVGSSGQVFVFALAPQDRVRGANDPDVVKVGFAKDGLKAETPIACVLAQLNAAGQMVAVTSTNLAAYLTGVLSAQGASVAILNGVPAGNVSGATFFVGYGASSTAMINSGVNRATVTVPGSLTCQPSAPQTGWWWNPAEDGRGFSIEKRGNNLFFASFLYDVSGRSTWHVSSGPVSLEGSLYNGDLLSASGGQTLGGAYLRFPALTNAGPMTMTFNNESTGTLVWPGGTVPIQRFNIVPNGLTQGPAANLPESGWWWNEQEAGRGFFLEWQGRTLDIAGYMYDDAGNPVWYLTVGEQSGEGRSFTGTWWSYGNGMTLSGPWRPHARVNANVAPLTITFSSDDAALMTLPNGRTTNLRRHRF